jgi:hypothetical protein
VYHATTKDKTTGVEGEVAIKVRESKETANPAWTTYSRPPELWCRSTKRPSLFSRTVINMSLAIFVFAKVQGVTISSLRSSGARGDKALVHSTFSWQSFRPRTGYSKSNPRKMVQLWAEKETRNLTRLQAAGVRCPTPILLRLHVLVMSFIGAEGVAAPRLRVTAGGRLGQKVDTGS